MGRPPRFASAWIFLVVVTCGVAACGRSDLFSARGCPVTDPNCKSVNGRGGVGAGGSAGGGGITGVGGFGGVGAGGFGGIIGAGGFGGRGIGGGVGGFGGVIGAGGFGGRGIGGGVGGFGGIIGAGGFGGRGIGGAGGCSPSATEICNNGVDDDCNGRVDCADPGCFGNRACVTLGVEICNNGLDDDADGLVDCADPDCMGNLACMPVMGTEICNNGVDDNKDGLTDCADPQCVTFPACVTVACNFDVDFGTLAAHGANVSRDLNTLGAAQGFASCVAPGGRGRVGRFVLGATTDVRVDITQAAGGAHAVSVFRAGTNQACDQNLVSCFDAGASSGTHTFPALGAGTYWLIVESHPGTQGDTQVRLSTGLSMVTEICNNGVDDDGNGLTDCQDLACLSAPTCALSQCVPDLGVGALALNGPARTVSFSTAGGADRYQPTCAGSSTAGDETISFTLPETGQMLLSYSQGMGDHRFGLFAAPGPGLACDSTQLRCPVFTGGPQGEIAFGNLGAGNYILIVKARSQAGEGPVTLTLRGLPNQGIELCSNGIDDDGDGLIDCADPDCFGVASCSQTACVPDVDLGSLAPGQSISQIVDVTAGKDLYQTTCGRGNGKERVLRFTATAPMGLGISCTETGSQVLEVSQQIAPLDACNAHPVNCADPSVVPFGCNFVMPGLQPGTYNLIVDGFQAGSEGVVNLTLTGVSTSTEICNNGIDDDGDGAIDCADRTCVTSPLCAQFACRPDNSLGVIPLNNTAVQVIVQTTAAGNDQQTMCASGTGGQDADVDFTLPGTADLVIQWAQFGNHDLELFANDGPLFACDAGASLACITTNGVLNGQQTLTRVPAGKYHLVVDADSAGNEGVLGLRISGTLSP